jgi:hypothetical protein
MAVLQKNSFVYIYRADNRFAKYKHLFALLDLLWFLFLRENMGGLHISLHVEQFCFMCLGSSSLE